MIKKIISLFISLIFTMGLSYGQTQIPNMNFEEWQQNYYNTSLPDKFYWECIPTNIWASGNVASKIFDKFSTYQTTDAKNGNYAACLETMSILGQPASGTLFTGWLEPDFFNTKAHFGVKFDGTPVSLQGWYKYIPEMYDDATDTAAIYAILSCWSGNSRTEVAIAEFYPFEDVTEYSYFDIPFVYHNELNPDTISVVFSSSKNGDLFQGGIGSKLFIDDINFYYFVIDFTWSGDECGGNEIVFTDSSTDENIQTRIWKVDGIEVANNDTSLTYTFPATNELVTYEVSLKIILNNGYEDEITKQISINPIFLSEETHNICQGETFNWRGNEYSETGTYFDNYTQANGCDSIYQLNLIANPNPESVVILPNPSNGILAQGANGSISLSTSYIGTNYWVTMGVQNFTQSIAGTGSSLDIGNNYPSGNFNIWSKNEHGCELLQGNVNFIENGNGNNDGTNKIVTNVTFGTPAVSFPSGHARVVLYKEEVDINQNDVVIYVTEQILTSNGQAEFSNLQPGNYYLGSYLIYPDNYNVSEHIFYQTSVMHENAVSIPVTTETVFIAGIHHPQLVQNVGTNSGEGNVSTGGLNKNTPLKNMIIILKDTDIDEIIDLAVTDENGNFSFEQIPNNANIEVWVTSFAHPNWTAYQFLTEENESYSLNFVVNGNNVYPETTGISDSQFENVLKTFPNPATSSISIETSIDKYTIELLNLAGQIVYKGDNTNIIDVSKYHSGTYIIKLTSNNFIDQKLIIIN